MYDTVVTTETNLVATGGEQLKKLTFHPVGIHTTGSGHTCTNYAPSKSVHLTASICGIRYMYSDYFI